MAVAVLFGEQEVRNKLIASFQACTRQVRYTPNCWTYRCGAANRRFGPFSDNRFGADFVAEVGDDKSVAAGANFLS
jgi:hypothetical protein